MNNILHPLPPKKLSNEKALPNGGTVRRSHKRKLSTPLHREEESSCCSSDDEDSTTNQCRTRKRYPVLSPASSCNSSAGIAVSASPKPVPNDDSDGGGGGGGSTSVKDLENAMSKHLPSSGIDKNSSPLIHQPTDFSTDTLLKQQQQRSTIQWIGAHHHHLNQLSHHQHAQPYSSPLPASALLKQLYANRESVIRANVHAAASGLTGNSGRNGSSPGIPYYSGDVNHVGPLPTPPGSEGSFSEQFSLSHNQKSNEAFSTLVSSYSSSSSYSVDYHTAAMTPPSSVSPRDKYQQQIHQHSNGSTFDSTVYNDVLRHQYLNSSTTADIPTQPLPLKPQAYTPMHHSALDAYTSASSLDQSQFYHSAGFHIYHPANKTSGSTSVYPDPIKNPSNWYPTPT